MLWFFEKKRKIENFSLLLKKPQKKATKE